MSEPVKIGRRCKRCGDGKMRPHLLKPRGSGGFSDLEIHHVFCTGCQQVFHSGLEGYSVHEVHQSICAELGIRPYVSVEPACPEHPSEELVETKSVGGMIYHHCPICLRHINN